MFGWNKNSGETLAAPPPKGMQELIICVYDVARRLKHHFRSAEDVHGEEYFLLLGEPEGAVESGLLSEAASTGEPVSIAFSYGGRSKYLYVLPFEQQGKHFSACVQLTLDRPKPDEALPACASALKEGRALFLIADEADRILAVGPRVPEAFGYSAEHLHRTGLGDLFGETDLSVLKSCSPDTNESILSSAFHCLDGTRREVEVKKYTAARGCTLFCICDVARVQLIEEVSAVAARERRRIGQDLHDSIGQMLTGISLLSCSLANSLERSGSLDSRDAKQVSELADEASNQIRQISRGLMPSEVVHRGLHASLRELASFTTQSCGLACSAQLDEGIEINDGAVETHLFRIAQEAVNNAVRHSGGDQVTIYVSDVNGNPMLEICDNGRWRHIMENQGGIGLKTMEYRASVINAQLNISRAETGGTRVTCRLEAEEYLETKVV